ncbi:predicted protein [Sclerotinia sclerotiorum 1980 UF-70]|uniref:BTB domain-containing protein n=2 Tax=Sclerotinia sclerotiorum (strain ATCC 18683 / 1980 / Ss-1) TaxID=665079 RepID=A7E9V1_SCLS1|nr:predicted protein [Sclerotinia sclerotiorum 1980 UF-70]APA05602.1 hypothetical protein sscle_01g003720 [Sclerotinia sclerotiorum 1980 UF-70]EDN97153.1 predicted protein [Sclerotinia sclerotiorum 1980 UF-70]
MGSYIHEHAYSGIVTVIVGPEGRPFFFHESLLCEKSPWFRAKLHSQKTEEYSDSAIELSPIETSFRDFQQSQREIIYRYEDDVHTSNQFFTWIYGCVYVIPRRDPESYDTAMHISEWVILHVLAVEMGVMDLAHKALWDGCASPDSYFEVESPITSSEYLDDISDLDLDDAAPFLMSDCGTVSAEEEDVYSRQERDEAMTEYYERRDLTSYVF